MNAKELRDFLIAVLEAEALHSKSGAEYMPDHFQGSIDRVLTFVDADVLTPLAGIVVQMESQAEYQIVIHQTRHAPVPRR